MVVILIHSTAYIPKYIPTNKSTLTDLHCYKTGYYQLCPKSRQKNKHMSSSA